MTYLNKDEVDYKAEIFPAETEVTRLDFKHKLAYIMLTILLIINFSFGLIMIGKLRSLTSQNFSLQQKNQMLNEKNQTLNTKAESLQQRLDALLKRNDNFPNK